MTDDRVRLVPSSFHRTTEPPCARSPLEELEAAAVGDPAERLALDQTWRAWSELLIAHDTAPAAGVARTGAAARGAGMVGVEPAAGAAQVELAAGAEPAATTVPAGSGEPADRWEMMLESRLRQAQRRRRRARPFALAMSLSLSGAVLTGLVWMEQRSQQTMARLERGQELTWRVRPPSIVGPGSAQGRSDAVGVNAADPPASGTVAADVAAANAADAAVDAAVDAFAGVAAGKRGPSSNSPLQEAAATASLATLWNDELDSQLGDAQEQLDSIRSAWDAPPDRLGRLADDFSERLRDLRETWGEDTL